MSANALGNSNLRSIKGASQKYAQQLRDSYKYLRFDEVGNAIEDRLAKSEIDGMSKLFHAIKKSMTDKKDG